MALSLPLTSNPLTTLQRWGAELRKMNFLFGPDYKVVRYQPELTTGAGTVSQNITRIAEYSKPKECPLVKVWLDIQFQLSSATTVVVYTTLPFPPFPDRAVGNGTYTGCGWIFESGNAKPAVVQVFPSKTRLEWRLSGAAAIATGLVAVGGYIEYPVL